MFDEPGYAIVSCYNALPLRGGAASLARVNLKKVAEASASEADFLDVQLPRYVNLNARLMRARVDYLFRQSGFFDGNFLVEEGWIDRDRFTAMFGIFAMAEAVNHLQDIAGRARPATDMTPEPTRSAIAFRRGLPNSSTASRWSTSGAVSPCCMPRQVCPAMRAPRPACESLTAASRIR